IREAQLRVLDVPKTGMAIAIDVGESKDIHPKNKKVVGQRLALWALGSVYGEQVPATSGPLPAGNEVRKGEIVVRFAHTNGGLVAKDGPLTGFIIAGADRAWKPASARIEGTTVIVSAPNVPQPVAVRYAWAPDPVCNLYNGAGLPASPFRTDTWETLTPP
ncbi:MAG: 9-O-acetylesterase, partial [Prosthecobacter sp.]|nr:9-O-acetylesterase [Prosthecobacter sp.]